MATSAMAGGVARMARGDGSGRRRGRAAQLPAGPGGASSAGGATENGAGAARRGTGGPERRRGGVPGSMAPELKRKGAGEDEGSVGKLTAHSNQTEEGRKVELDGRGRRSERPSMAAGGEVVDSAGDWLERALDGAEEVKGKAREVGA